MTCLIESNRTCTFLDCDDSPLSTSGNVISILTFVVAAIATYLAFFQDVRDIPQSADEYSNDIRSLHDQLWTIGDIHAQLAKLMASNDNFRISDVILQSRLRQGQSESLKEAKKFLEDYSASYQAVFTNYFKRHRWIVRVKWLLQQKKVEHFKKEASELRNSMTLDLLAITLNMNVSLQQALHERDTQTEKLSRKIDLLSEALGKGGTFPAKVQFANSDGSNSPSPSVMIDPTAMEPPTFVISPPEDEEEETEARTEAVRSPSRSPSPFSTRKPLDKSFNP